MEYQASYPNLLPSGAPFMVGSIWFCYPHTLEMYIHCLRASSRAFNIILLWEIILAATDFCFMCYPGTASLRPQCSRFFCGGAHACRCIGCLSVGRMSKRLGSVQSSPDAILVKAKSTMCHVWSKACSDVPFHMEAFLDWYLTGFVVHLGGIPCFLVHFIWAVI